jgi:hypothetical protein
MLVCERAVVFTLWVAHTVRQGKNERNKKNKEVGWAVQMVGAADGEDKRESGGRRREGGVETRDRAGGGRGGRLAVGGGRGVRVATGSSRRLAAGAVYTTLLIVSRD